MAERSREEAAQELHDMIVEAAEKVDHAFVAASRLQPGSAKLEAVVEYLEECRGRLDRARDPTPEELAGPDWRDEFVEEEPK